MNTWRILRLYPARWVPTCLTAACLVSGCHRGPETSAVSPLPEHVVARIGSTLITKEALAAEQKRHSSSRSEAQVLEHLIQRDLLFAEARRRELDRTPELEAAWKNLVVQRIREQREEELDRLPAPSTAAVEAHYKRNSESYLEPVAWRAALIQLSPDRNAGSVDRAIHRQEAESLRSQVRLNPDPSVTFRRLAERHSIHRASRNQGGDLGFLTLPQFKKVWPSEVTEALSRLTQPGEISPVISTAEGVFLFQLLELRPARQKPLEMVRDQIVTTLRREQRADAERTWFDRLRQTHALELNPDYRPAVAPSEITPPAQLPRTPGS